MFDFIKTFFRKRSLRKHSSTQPGRAQRAGNPLDLGSRDPAGKEVSQLDCFTAIKGYLTKIQ